ncbi:ABC transporter permease [Proteinivorax hydrogeniformans]|uniref:ABC transporter permease n=1 Tax=Proteinivorax hydrogeniformans TaxID=1826727 RepID=A0AAU8HTR1_9FIRM
MKSITSLALRYLWQQKKRTGLTILGIIISVSMITSIGTILMSFRDTEIQRIKEEEGAHHVTFYGLDLDQYSFLKANSKLNKVAMEIPAGHGYIGAQYSNTADIPKDATTVNFIGYNGDFFELSRFKLTEGRGPEKKNEVALEEWLLHRHDLSVGDMVELPLGHIHRYEGDEGVWIDEFSLNKVKKFEIVGTVTRPHKGIAGVGVLPYDVALENQGERSPNAFFTVKSGLSVTDTTEEIAREINLEEGRPYYNRYLLLLKGQVVDDGAAREFAAIGSIVLFLVSLVTLATIAVIYNSFNISMLERVKQFGIMRSIGATPKQIRRIVYVEAAIQSVIAIPLGLMAGVLAMHTVFYLLSKDAYSTLGNFTVTTSPFVLLISAIVGFIAVIFSALIPAVNAGRKQPLEAIFYRPKLKKQKYKKRKGFILSKLFSWEISLAYKNLQRNKKRFIITAFSLSISVILFIVFSIFSHYALRIDSTRAYYTEDFELVNNETKVLYSDQDYTDILELTGVESAYPKMEYWAELIISPDDVSRQYEQQLNKPNGERLNDPIDGMDVRIIGYNKALFNLAEKELTAGSVNYSELKESAGVLLVQNNRIFTDTGLSIVPVTDYSVGDTVTIDLGEGEKFEYKVMGILDRAPIGNDFGTNGEPFVIMADEIYQDTVVEGYDGFYVNAEEGIDSTTHMALNDELTLITERVNGFVHDNLHLVRRDRQVMREISVFIYGFIVLISVIGALNIINTVSTNLLTRTKEFAMLRAVGMGPKSLINMIRYEAILSGVIGVIYGCIIGNLLGYWLYNLMSDIREVPWEFPWTPNIIVIIAAIVVSLLASRATVQRVKEMNIIDTLREE